MMTDFVKATHVYTPQTDKEMTLPFYTSTIAAGMPSPAEPYEDEGLDLHAHLGVNKTQTVIIRIQGNVMRKFGLHCGDLVIVDQSLTPKPDQIVLVDMNGELIVRKWDVVKGRPYLKSGKMMFSSTPLDAITDCKVLGVVTYTIHTV